MLKVSILTVCYNSEKTIRDTIESVLTQTYQNIEYIIVDGASKDNTLEIVKSYQERVTKYISEPDGGIYDAMNKAIALATGDVIGILNSDDLYIDNSVVEKMMNIFISKPQIDVAYANIMYVDKNNLDHVIRKVESKPFYEDFFYDGEIVPHPTFFARSKVYKQVGKYSLKLRLAADYEYILRVLCVHKFQSYYLDQYIVKMRMGGATTLSLKSIIAVNKEIIEALKKNGLKTGFFFIIKRIIKKLSQFKFI